MKKGFLVTHLTSAHPRNDIRIFIKECCSLSSVEYKTILIVADGNPDEIINNVTIVGIQKENTRLKRMILTPKHIFKKAIKIDADLYHIHDPELLKIGLKLKKLGKIVIFDSHEDVPKQILSKEYIHPLFRSMISNLFKVYERIVLKRYDYIITATSSIRDKFKKFNQNVVDINNYPIVSELSNNIPWSAKVDEICYVGGITKIRGIREIITSLKYVSGIKLNLVGKFSDTSLEEEVKSFPTWNHVNELGFLNREDVAYVLSRSKAGLVTFYPVPNHIDAQPNKMFEYMSAGLPVIATNIPLWREIIEGNECGICVNSLSPKEISEAIKRIINNPEEAEQMGKNGRKAIIEKYNWKNEEQSLFRIYKKLLYKNLV